jgi:DNA-binding transcriptional LysR family regulator
MDRLDELAVFAAVLEAGSLAGAGRRLRRSAPAVTRILAALEARVGVRLVERTTRRLAPTDAGRRLAEPARRALAAYDEAVQAVADDGRLRGRLRVTAPLVFGRRHVAPVVASFLDAHPDVTAELELHDRNVDLIAHEVDVAVRIGPLADSGLVARRVGQVRRLLVASPAYLARHGTPARPRDLAGHAILHSSGVPGAPVWRFAAPAPADQAVRLAPRLTVNEIDALLAAACAGRGIARPLSYQVADELADGRLVRLLPDFEPEPLPVHLVVPSARHMPRPVRAFLDHAAVALSALAVIR